MWLLLGGRGAGKTFAGSHWLAERALSEVPGEWIVAAPTIRDCRVTCIEGPSGLLNALGGRVGNGGHVANYLRSLGEIRLDNGAVIYALSADEPDRFRGGNQRGAWADELAAWPNPDAWDQLTLATRIGSARIVATTTPRPTPLIKGLLGRPDVVSVRASTFANQQNLSGAFLEQVQRQYEGSRLGRQELYAEILEDVEGALFHLGQIEACRVKEPPELRRIVVAVDPAGTNRSDSDETGVVVAGQGVDGEFYVLEDGSLRESPHGWATRVVGLYERWQAHRIVAEKNMGWDMVEHTIRTVSPNVPLKTVRAADNKIARAEPIAALYEQGRVHHVGVHAGLEDQITSWSSESKYSPDRLDALVWALMELSEPARTFAQSYF